MYRLFIILLPLLSLLEARGQELDSLLSIEIRSDTNSVKVLNKLYDFHINSEPTKALDFTMQALDIAIELKYKKGIAYCYNNNGVFYKNQGATDKALSYYLESLELNREIGNITGEAFTMNNIGAVYSLQGDFNNALRYFRNSFDILDSIGVKTNLVGALNNLGNIYLSKGEDYRAIAFYKSALRIYLEDRKGSFDPYLNIGKVYFVRGENKRAKTYFEQSLALNTELNNLLGQAFAYHYLASWHRSNNNSKLVLENELKALRMAEEVNNTPLLKDIHLALAEIYYSQGDIENAYTERVLYDAYKDAILNDESARKLAQLEVTYQLLEKEKQVEILKKENEVNKLKVSNTKTVIILGIMGTFLIMASLIIVYVLKMNKKSGILHA